ncbi:MAG: response regulator [Sulfuritalea sp.]|nr:response regulator [Sulfuritalea sp.]
MANDPTIVLIVDDEPANIDLLKGVLPGEYKFKVAISGEKALKIAQKEPHPDLVLLDVMMPEMDGYEVCRQLKADPATANIPVVFVSGHTDDAERQKGIAAGATDFISKPIDPEVVQAVVKSIVDPG